MGHLIPFLIVTLSFILLDVKGKPTLDDDLSPESFFRKSILNKNILDPEDAICTPRFECGNARKARQLFQDLAYTDSVNKNLYSSPIPINPELIELPPESENNEFASQLYEQSNDGDISFEAVEVEIDEDENNYIYSMKEDCTQDQLDYCNDNRFGGSNHTMCKYCGLGSKCPYYLNPQKNDVTGRSIKDQETIDYILQLHNEVRSKIARGRCNQPKAGCMGPLQWDPELARVAQKWADQCAEVDYKGDLKRKDPLLYHDKHGNRKIDRFSNWQGTGQNVARDISRGTRGVFDAHKLVGHWFNQILYFDPVAVGSFGSGNQCSHGIGYYTQLVWQDTTHVGCGWIQFQYRGFGKYFENFLICNYGPSANIWKQPVYDEAKDVCNCPCIGCDPSTGLCPANCKYATWSSWESWSKCSTSCGGGSRRRERGCEESDTYIRPTLASFRVPESTLLLRNQNVTNTRVFEEGKMIDKFLCKNGRPTELGKCGVESCPQWSSWSSWSKCSVSCGGGNQSRSRTCQATSSAFLGVTLVCEGAPIESRKCNEDNCPVLSKWSEWSSCSKKCGTGERTKERTCNGEIYPSTQNPCQKGLFERQTCNTEQCPSYTEWSDWSKCTVKCGGGTQGRARSCVLPKFKSDLTLKCEGGPSEETRVCNTNKCPSWSAWSKWTSCSVTCGGGKRRRTRKCGYFGLERETNETLLSCDGENYEEDTCNLDKCPELGPWSDWSECSSSCGDNGIRSRKRECGLQNAKVRDLTNPCKEPLTEVQKCNEFECPVFGAWSEWTSCSATCGGGSQKRERKCSGKFCEGEATETRKCNGNTCPVWTEWSQWTACSVTCGGGKRHKNRECVLPSGERSVNLFCPGKSEIVETCNPSSCPELGPWSDWSVCSASCGAGKRSRFRECGLPKTRSSDNPCKKPLKETEICNPQRCPSFTDWSEWSECSHTCGGGFRKKSRECTVNSRDSRNLFRSNPCNGPLELVEECNREKCPSWTSWGDWTMCSKSCSGGERSRYRQCADESGKVGLFCSGKDSDKESCNTDECPTHTKWTEWTTCTKSCGVGGIRTRIRKCLDESSLTCEDETQKEKCNEDVNCPTWSDWTEWSACSVTCGGGNEKRIRDCLKPRNLNGTNFFGCVGDTWEMRPCNVQKCPQWTDWSSWSKCSVSCGSGGRRKKKRECKIFQFSSSEENNVSGDINLFCPGENYQYQSCNGGIEKCPVPGEWSAWSKCSKSCGPGIQKRIRECINSRFRNGNPCNVDLEETKDCNLSECPIWSEWTEWTECSKSCGKGIRSKSRECVNFIGCSGSNKLMEACNDIQCPSLTQWSEWTQCSKSCGSGSQRRERDCLRTKSGFQNPCFQPLEETRECNSHSCPKWGQWSEWSECSKECGNGTKSRVRNCVDNFRSVCALGESSEETDSCNVQSCPAWTSWSTWSECTASCGGGTRQRARECTRPQLRNGQLICSGSSLDIEVCNLEACPSWAEWSEWSSCSSSCHPGGTRKRERKCSTENVKDCGDKRELFMSETCNTNKVCPEGWSSWGEWSSCTTTCGGGTKKRLRECNSVSFARYGPFSQEEPEACPGPSEITLFCNLDDCPTTPIPAYWSSWTSWSQCSKTCGGGARIKTRECSGEGCPGDDRISETCNDFPCPSWTEWSSWSSCSSSCGEGTQKRSRGCRRVRPKLGLFFSPCKGDPEESRKCNLRKCIESPSPGISIEECKSLGAPSTFGSFSGRPAISTADCVWDFFTCTKRYGTYPRNKPCCDARFELCCQAVMGLHGNPPSQTHENIGYYPPNSEEPESCSEKYEGCLGKGTKTERRCKLDYNDCTLSSNGITPSPSNPISSTERPINDIDLADIPEFLRPSSSTERPLRPINDIDLPQQQDFVLQNGDPDPDSSFVAAGEGHSISGDDGFMACLLKHFDCVEGETKEGIDCPTLRTCSDLVVEPVVSEKEEVSDDAEIIRVPQHLFSFDNFTELAPETDDSMKCVKGFFSCNEDPFKCKSNFKRCVDRLEDQSLSAQLVDNVCAKVEEDSQSYLVPHPTDCTKFYSCQSLGPKGRYKAHLMDCPNSTGFDRKLRICNFIQSLPRCRKDIIRQARLLRGKTAYQTLTGRSHSQVAEVGYLSSDIKESSSSAVKSYILVTIVTSIIIASLNS